MRFLMDMFHKYDKVGLCGGEHVCWHVWDCVCWGVWECVCVGGVGTCVLEVWEHVCWVHVVLCRYI